MSHTSRFPLHARAHSWAVKVCGEPDCHPHLVFFDEQGNILCDGVIHSDLIPKLNDDLQRAAAQIQQERN
jgi:hypothetical protein